MKSLALHAGADTTGETLEHIRVLPLAGALSDTDHVTGAAVFRLNRAQNMIEQSAFMKVGVVRVGPKCEKFSRHLDHVIDVAGFGRPAIDHILELVRLTEVFIDRL